MTSLEDAQALRKAMKGFGTDEKGSRKKRPTPDHGC